MPFTLAHPAAVLPLKHYCPRPLNFCALVVGSLAPDAGYCFERLNWDELSHHFIGSFTFDLLASLVILLFIYALRHPLLGWLPGRLKPLLLPQCWQPVPPPVVMLISILIGVWTHLILDSFTRNQGWMAVQFPVLQVSLGTLHQHNFQVCRILWYLFSFMGITGVCLAYQRRLHSANPGASAVRWRNAVLVGLLLLPIEVAHHLVHGMRSVVLVGACTFLLLIGVALKVSGERANSRKPQETPP
jgi:hypothetical protein